MIKSAIVIWSILSIIMTILPFLKVDHWWVRAFDFPRIQIIILTGLNIIAFLSILNVKIFWQDLVLALLLCSLIYQAKMIFPYTRLAPKQSLKTKSERPDTRISIMVANVLTPNRRSADLLRIVEKKNPDLLLIVEVDDWWEEQLSPLDSSYSFTVKQTINNQYGMHLYSKLKLLDPQIKFLVEDEVPSIHSKVVLRSGQSIKLYCLHPKPPSPTENSQATERDAELLIIGKQINRTEQAVIVAGDLNDVAWSYTTRLFLKISGLLDPRRGRGFFNTFHADYPLLRWPLDHVFHTNNFMLYAIERLPYFGSDHFPIFIQLNLEEKAKAIQDAPTANQEEQREATEKIEKADTLSNNEK